MALADTLLVTAAELEAHQRTEVAALTGDGYAELMLTRAQAGLMSYLGFDPFIHKVTRFLPAWGMPSGYPSQYVPWTAPGNGPPIVQVDASDYEDTPGYYTIAISADGESLEVLTTNPLPYVLDLYEGWRGSNHSITGAGSTIDLNTLPGLTDLTVLPAEAPQLVKAAIMDAASYFARYVTTVGQQSYTLDLGAQVKTAENVAALNDVNVLIGRTSELTAIYQTCHRWRRVHA